MEVTEEIVELVLNGDNSASSAAAMNTQSFLVSIGVAFGFYLISVLIFCFSRKRIRSVFEPRTFILAKNKRMRSTPDGFFGWIKPLYQTPVAFVKKKVGLDAYLFLRYHLFVIGLCIATAIPYTAVLIPLHVIGGKNDETTTSFLDILSSSNIRDTEKDRQIAHLVMCCYQTIIFVCAILWELKNYFREKAKYLTSYEDIPGSTSTLLVKGLYKEYSSEEAIDCYFATLDSTNSNTVCRIWMNRDYTELNKLIQEREKILNKLEHYELWLVKRCSGIGIPREKQLQEINNNKDASIIGNLWKDYLIEDDLREMHGRVGKMITWLKGDLGRLNAKIYTMQREPNLFPQVDSCFIQFEDRLKCFTASRSLGTGAHASPGVKIYDKIHPADVIWENLVVKHWFQVPLKIFAVIMNYLFIFGWTFPVALISMFTQTELLSRWLPSVSIFVESNKVAQFMSSLVSPLIVSMLTSQIPTFFRVLARLKGYPTNTLVEMDVQKYVFLFMFFQLFVIATLATGLPTLVFQILLNLNEGAITLASSLPHATTFFISYLLASSFTTAASTFLQSDLLSFYFLDLLLAKTPRDKMKSTCRHNTPFWGSIFPLVTHITVVSIAYAIISPIILWAAVIGLVFLYTSFKYRILYCYVPRCNADGDYYPIALFQLFSGLYCQQVSLIGTLLVSQQPKVATLAALLLVATAFAHHSLRKFFIDWNTRIPIRPAEEDTFVQTRPDEPRGGGGGGGTLPKITELPLPSGIPLATGTGYPIQELKELRSSYQEPSPAISLASGNTLVDEGTPQLPPKPNTVGVVHHYERPFVELRSEPLTCNAEFEQCPITPISPHSPSTPDAMGSSIDSVDKSTWVGMFDELESSFNRLNLNQKNYIESQLFTHPSFKLPRSCVWIPEDRNGVAMDQVREMQTIFTDLRASCSGVQLHNNGDFMIHHPPPDFDPRELMEL